MLFNASRYLPLDDGYVPTGEIASVEGTRFDLREGKDITEIFEEDASGFNHNFCLDLGAVSGRYFYFLRKTRNVNSNDSFETPTLKLTLRTTQPGVQLYTSFFLPEEKVLLGKGGAAYVKNGSFALEPQGFVFFLKYF
jgi:aldose 1-epimerase